tara:strand:+ start:216 stop:722 length:507 start_codon:yes stop_codon:yes gene_type:complete
VYRDFKPDYLIAVDTKMVNEIVQYKYQNEGQVWTNYNKSYEKYKGLNYFEPSKGWSSGPTALDFASEHGHQTIYILGFDYQGIGPENKRVNNLYSGTPNYKREHDTSTYYGNWLRQTTTVLQKNSKKRYIRVVATDKSFIPEPLESFANISHITVEDLAKSFNFSLNP